MISVFDLFDKKVINIDDNVCFDILTTLIFYDYPRCFIAKKNDGELYAFMECEDNEEKVAWVISKVDLNMINQVNIGKANVQSLFLGCNQEVVYYFGSEQGLFREMNSTHAIQGNYYSKNFCDMDELFDYHGLQFDAKETFSNSVSVVLEDNKQGNTGPIFKAICYLRDLFMNLNNPFDIMNSNLKVKNASTVITFSSVSDVQRDYSLTPELDADYTDSFIELGNVLNANEPEILLSYSSKNRKFINKYKGFLNSIKKEENLRPKIVVAVNKFEQVKSFEMYGENTRSKTKVVNSAKELIKNKTEVINNIIQVEGILTGIYSKKKVLFRLRRLDQRKENSME